jgi:hypothetical protein
VNPSTAGTRRSRQRRSLTGWWRMRGVRAAADFISNDRLWYAWLRAYRNADSASIEQPALRCPCCGRVGLRLVYTGGEDPIGFASFWCATCLTGIHLCRVGIPAGAPRRPWQTSDDSWEEAIDDYRLVFPHRNEQLLRRWSKRSVAALGLCLGLILVAALLTAVLGLPDVAATLLHHVLPWVFIGFGIACAVRLLDRWQDSRDLDPDGPPPRWWPHISGRN